CSDRPATWPCMMAFWRLPLLKSISCLNAYSAPWPAIFGKVGAALLPSWPWHAAHGAAFFSPAAASPSTASADTLNRPESSNTEILPINFMINPYLVMYSISARKSSSVQSAHMPFGGMAFRPSRELLTSASTPLARRGSHAALSPVFGAPAAPVL